MFTTADTIISYVMAYRFIVVENYSVGDVQPSALAHASVSPSQTA
jgi:hypothetical protein